MSATPAPMPDPARIAADQAAQLPGKRAEDAAWVPECCIHCGLGDCTACADIEGLGCCCGGIPPEGVA